MLTVGAGRLYSLDMGALLAGASYKGEYEQRVKDVLAEVEKAENAGQILILFIDEMHLIMAGKGDSGMQASELFKPMLARGKLRTIGATTLSKPLFSSEFEYCSNIHCQTNTDSISKRMQLLNDVSNKCWSTSHQSTKQLAFSEASEKNTKSTMPSTSWIQASLRQQTSPIDI